MAVVEQVAGLLPAEQRVRGDAPGSALEVDLSCTAWAIPSYSLKGWQKPCYLMDDGHVSTYKELLETTDWDSYGRGKDPRCANCMAHCGYEPSAVFATMGSLRESLRAAASV